jgi:hypothetical protein
MNKLLPFLFIGLPVVADAQSKQQLVAQSKYNYSSSVFERTDSSSFNYMPNSPAGKPAYLPEVLLWNCDTIYTYDLSNQIISRTKNTYNSDGSLAEYYTENAVTQGWPYARRTVITYNNNGKVTQKEVWLAANSSSPLLTDRKETYSYDTNNQLTEYVFYQSLSGGTSYVPMTRIKYTYSGGLLTDVYEEHNSINSWEAFMRTTYAYPTATTMEETVEMGGHSGWTLSARTSSVLDGSRRILSSLREEYNGSTLQPARERIYTYDVNGNILTFENKIWRGGVKENFEKTEYTYNSDNNMLISLLKRWDGAAYVVKEGSAGTYN